MGSLMIGPVVSGAMASHVGWRNFWWLNVALLALSFLMILFMFPETKWHRAHPDEIESSLPSSEKENLAVIEKANTSLPQVISVESQKPEHPPGAATAAAADPWLGRGSPSKKQWALFQPNAHPWKSIALDLWVPWKLFAFPIVEFASFVVSWSCSCFLTLNLTQTQAFAVPPYNWSSQSIGGQITGPVRQVANIIVSGFTNFAVLVGSFVGLATAGPFSDWVSARATKRNGGIREPEMRLPAMIPYVLIMFLGNVIVSVGYQNHWPWEAIVLIGYTCAGIQVAALPGIVSTYAVDSYKPVAGSLFVSITVNKNVWGYGFSKFITDWIISDGYIPPIMTNASLTLLWCLFGILFYYKGKTFRRWTRKSSVHMM